MTEELDARAGSVRSAPICWKHWGVRKAPRPPTTSRISPRSAGRLDRRTRAGGLSGDRRLARGADESSRGAGLSSGSPSGDSSEPSATATARRCRLSSLAGTRPAPVDHVRPSHVGGPGAGRPDRTLARSGAGAGAGRAAGAARAAVGDCSGGANAAAIASGTASGTGRLDHQRTRPLGASSPGTRCGGGARLPGPRCGRTGDDAAELSGPAAPLTPPSADPSATCPA